MRDCRGHSGGRMHLAPFLSKKCQSAVPLAGGGACSAQAAQVAGVVVVGTSQPDNGAGCWSTSCPLAANDLSDETGNGDSSCPNRATAQTREKEEVRNSASEPETPTQQVR